MRQHLLLHKSNLAWLHGKEREEKGGGRGIGEEGGMRGRRGTTEEGKGWMDTGKAEKDTGEGGGQNERKEGRQDETPSLSLKLQKLLTSNLVCATISSTAGSVLGCCLSVSSVTS